MSKKRRVNLVQISNKEFFLQYELFSLCSSHAKGFLLFLICSNTIAHAEWSKDKRGKIKSVCNFTYIQYVIETTCSTFIYMYYHFFQANGKTGYFPRSFVREYKVENPSPKYYVPTEVTYTTLVYLFLFFFVNYFKKINPCLPNAFLLKLR